MRRVVVVNLHPAKTQLSKLVDRAAAGEDILIARAGKPVARLTALARPRPARKPGLLKGKLRISSDFDQPLPADVIAAFYGGDLEPRR